MTSDPRETEAVKLSRAELYTLLGAVFAGFPILFCAMRVLVVSGGDPNTLRMLVQNVDLKSLVLATILPLGGTLMFWFQVGLWLFAYAAVTPPEYRRLLKVSFYCTLPVTVATLWVAMPRVQWLVSVFLLATALVVIMAHQRLRTHWLKVTVTTVGTLVFLGIVVSLVVTFVSSKAHWLPFERIDVQGSPSVEGWVLGSDEEWTRYMDSSDRRIYIVKTSDVKSRQMINR